MRDDLVDRLTAAGCVAATAEAAELLAAAPDDDVLEQWIGRREQGEPLAWITGSAVFCGRRVAVAPGVYVPRPQTEQLAGRAAVRLPPHGFAVDLCTGSGAVAAHLSAEVPSAIVVGIDVDERAAACARRNGVSAVVGDLDAPLRAGPIADVVTAVAPYVPTADLVHLPSDVLAHEPRRALDGGVDGLDVARQVVDASARILRGGGWVLLELGGDQDERLAPWLDAAGFERIERWHDEDGDLRGLAARHAGRRGAG